MNIRTQMIEQDYSLSSLQIFNIDEDIVSAIFFVTIWRLDTVQFAFHHSSTQLHWFKFPGTTDFYFLMLTPNFHLTAASTSSEIQSKGSDSEHAKNSCHYLQRKRQHRHVAHKLPLGPHIRVRPRIQRVWPPQVQTVYDQHLSGSELTLRINKLWWPWLNTKIMHKPIH